MPQEKLVLALDSSQLATFDECPTKWHYQYQEGLVPINARSTYPMDMGTYGHKLMEIFYKKISEGRSRLDAMDDAINFDVDKEVCHCFHNTEKHKYINTHQTFENNLIQEHFDIGCQAIGCHCESFEPVEFPLTPEQRKQVKDRFCEYCFVEGTAIPFLIPHSPKHVEVGFSKKIYEDDKRLYILEGRVDLMGQIANNVENGWADHKWQLRETDLYLKTIQFRNYAMVLELSLGVVNYVRLAKKFEVGKTFKRDVISFSKQEMDWWKNRVIEMFRQVEVAVTLVQGVFLNPHNQWYQENDSLRHRSACSGKYGYPCAYTQICENSFKPQFIKIIETTDYTKRPIWRPW